MNFNQSPFQRLCILHIFQPMLSIQPSDVGVADLCSSQMGQQDFPCFSSDFSFLISSICLSPLTPMNCTANMKTIMRPSCCIWCTFHASVRAWHYRLHIAIVCNIPVCWSIWSQYAYSVYWQNMTKQITRSQRTREGTHNHHPNPSTSHALRRWHRLEGRISISKGSQQI